MKTGMLLRAATLVATLALGMGVGFAVIPHGDAQTQSLDSFVSDDSSKACARSKHDLERNKHNAVSFYTVAFNDKDPRRAVALYGGDEYIQHNPLAANGFDAFISFVEGFTTAFPDAHIDIRRVIAECDLVVTHSLATGAVPVYTALGTKVVDIFRLDANGKVVEHWDVGAAISATSANGNPEV